MSDFELSNIDPSIGGEPQTSSEPTEQNTEVVSPEEGMQTPTERQEQIDPQIQIAELLQQVSTLTTLVETQRNDLDNLRTLVSAGLMNLADSFKSYTDTKDPNIFINSLGNLGRTIADRRSK